MHIDMNEILEKHLTVLSISAILMLSYHGIW